MSEPETASSADSAAVSMTPRRLRLLGRRRRLAVADDALDQAGALQRERERAAHQAAADHAELVEHRRPVCGSVRVDRVGAEQLEEGARLAQLLQRRGDVAAGRDGPAGRRRSSTPTGPSAPAATRSASSRRRAPSAARSMSCTAPGRFATETTRLVQSCPDAFGCGCASGWATIGEAGAVVGVVLDRRRDDDAGRTRSPRARWRARRACGSRLARRAPSALLATGRRSASGQVVAEPGVALGERLRMGADGGDAVERVALGAAGCGARTGWSRRR